MKIYLAKGIGGTTAIEGNTLTEEEVKRQIDGELELPPSKEYMKQEVVNIIRACNEQIGPKVSSGDGARLVPEDLLSYNKAVLDLLPLKEGVRPGKIRSFSVGVMQYRGAPHSDCRHLLERMCQWLNDELRPPGDSVVELGILKAILAHLYVVWIHPFGDGNGRTARLVELQLLFAAGVPKSAAQLLSNHYNLTRSEYYRHLDLSHQSQGGVLAFLEYALQGFVDGLREHIGVIQQQQILALWTNHIHEAFRGKDGRASVRRRRLAIDITRAPEPVPQSEVPLVSARMAAAYAGLTGRTIARDLNFLTSIGLLRRTKNGYEAAIESMLAFLPERIDHQG